ncbi:hypothetical protein I203_103994 [Kwoniella mangroviensis CBS 8507]|uniref:uncharacterized protein n=1 Tax=Kwoniella mangroviensis CBS 8507 TaxID=1296122 RepID=UPI003060F7AC
MFIPTIVTISCLIVLTNALPLISPTNDTHERLTQGDTYDIVFKRQCPSSGEICVRVGGVFQCSPCTSSTVDDQQVSDEENGVVEA